jgi:voltage-gated potassium channel
VETFTFRRFWYAIVAVAVVLGAGTIGFRLILDEPWLQALYRAVISASLTGLDTVPEGDSARVLTIVLVLAGISIFAYVGSLIVEVIARGVLGGLWAERRRRRMLEALHDHYIVCGFGRVGRRIAEEFSRAGAPFVVLDFNASAIAAARERDVPFLEGNGTDDEDLARAGLQRARGLVAASDDDADNLYIALSARAAKPDLLIVARASNEDAAKKLQLAGANRVVQPYIAAGRVMASLLLKPQVSAFLDVAMAASSSDLRFEEILVTDDFSEAGKTIRELDIRRKTGALVVALRKHDGTFDMTPTPDARLERGDVLIVAGTLEELTALERLFAPQEAFAG